MFAIEIHFGFLIKAYKPEIRNCACTKIAAEAKHFATVAEANQFITDHDGNGLSKNTAKVIPV